MKIVRRPAAAFLILAGLAFGGSVSAQQARPQGQNAPAAILLDNMPNFREAYLAQLFGSFRAATGLAPGLTEDDVQKAKQAGVAALRAQTLITFFSSDLDNDEKVTWQEYQSKQRRIWPQSDGNAAASQLAKQFADLDGDGDGIVTFEEARAAAARNADAQIGRGYGNDRLERLLALDPNQDGILTGNELEQIGRAAFAYYDRDGDGVLSADERKSLASDTTAQRQAAMFREQFSRCKFPAADSKELLFLIDANKAEALSSVSVVGQDKVTETAEIAIEAGDAPLYVIALGRGPIIWRVTGNVGRVTHFVAATNGAGVGVTGLPKAVVTLSENMSCLSNRVSDNQAAVRETAWALEAVIGQPLRGIVYRSFSKTQLPSGATLPDDVPVASPAPGAALLAQRSLPLPPIDADTNAVFLRNHPGGLVEIDPAQVLSPSPVAAYEVPPMEAGLLKMLADGTLTQIGRRAYVINRPIPRTPAGLTGLNAVHYSLAPGVAPPPGYPVGPLNSPNGFRDLRPKQF